jgi:hypothetical protein
VGNACHRERLLRTGQTSCAEPKTSVNTCENRLLPPILEQYVHPTLGLLLNFPLDVPPETDWLAAIAITLPHRLAIVIRVVALSKIIIRPRRGIDRWQY